MVGCVGGGKVLVLLPLPAAPGSVVGSVLVGALPAVGGLIAEPAPAVPVIAPVPACAADVGPVAEPFVVAPPAFSGEQATLARPKAPITQLENPR